MEAIIDKLDLQKADPNYYRASKNPEIRDLDSYYYLSVEGRGHPESQPVWTAIEQLYAVAYSIKYNCKAEDMDFKVPKMEGYWWIDGSLETQHLFPKTPKEQWNWKFVIRMPDFVEEDHFYRAMQKVILKKQSSIKGDEVSLELIKASRCIQILHIGSYDNEEANIMKIMNHVEKEGLQINGYHNEIYLSDPRRTSEDKLKTILRYSVKS